MRWITFSGVGLIVVGALVLAASSGAFDSTSADRAVGIETTTDEKALLGLEKPDQISLAGGNLVCEGFLCYNGYREYNIDVLTIIDRTPPPELAIEESHITLDTSGSENPTLESWYIDGVNGEYIVKGEFRCAAPFWSQQSGSTTLVFDIKTSNGEISISLEREITVQCE